MDSLPPLCSTCAKCLLTDDDDPALVEARNRQGQPVLSRLEPENNEFVSSDVDKEVDLEYVEWPQFLAGTWQPMMMVPDSCSFCAYLLQLLASEAVKEVVRDQEKKSGQTCRAVSVGVERMWSSRDFSIAASFNGIQVYFYFWLSKGPNYDSRDVWTQHFILVPHASSGEKLCMDVYKTGSHKSQTSLRSETGSNARNRCRLVTRMPTISIG